VVAQKLHFFTHPRIPQFLLTVKIRNVSSIPDNPPKFGQKRIEDGHFGGSLNVNLARTSLITATAGRLLQSNAKAGQPQAVVLLLS
jgi:hypothetical protein